MSAGAAIAVAVSVASDVRGRVDERGYLELVPVPIRNIREGLGKVDVFAAADIDSRGGLSTEFVRVSVGIIGGKFDLMDMRFAFPDCLPGLPRRKPWQICGYDIRCSCRQQACSRLPHAHAPGRSVRW